MEKMATRCQEFRPRRIRDMGSRETTSDMVRIYFADGELKRDKSVYTEEDPKRLMDKNPTV